MVRFKSTWVVFRKFINKRMVDSQLSKRSHLRFALQMGNVKKSILKKIILVVKWGYIYENKVAQLKPSKVIIIILHDVMP